MALLDKSVLLWAENIPGMVLEKVYGGNVLGVTTKGFSRSMGVWPVWKREVIGMSISHVGDLLISGDGLLYHFVWKSGRTRHAMQ